MLNGVISGISVSSDAMILNTAIFAFITMPLQYGDEATMHSGCLLFLLHINIFVYFYNCMYDFYKKLL